MLSTTSNGGTPFLQYAPKHGSAGWRLSRWNNPNYISPIKPARSLAQGELLDRADRYCRTLILGQTMTGTHETGKGGGQAFGKVEEDVNQIDRTPLASGDERINRHSSRRFSRSTTATPTRL